MPLEQLLGYQLRRAWLAIGSDLGQRLEPLGLTGMSLSVLLMIKTNPGVSQSELAREMSIKRANMTPLTAQFAERGWVERIATDGRSHGLRLTPAGKVLTDLAWQAVQANERKFLECLAEDDRTSVHRILRALRSGADTVHGARDG